MIIIISSIAIWLRAQQLPISFHTQQYHHLHCSNDHKFQVNEQATLEFIKQLASINLMSWYFASCLMNSSNMVFEIIWHCCRADYNFWISRILGHRAMLICILIQRFSHNDAWIIGEKPFAVNHGDGCQASWVRETQNSNSN